MSSFLFISLLSHAAQSSRVYSNEPYIVAEPSEERMVDTIANSPNSSQKPDGSHNPYPIDDHDAGVESGISQQSAELTSPSFPRLLGGSSTSAAGETRFDSSSLCPFATPVPAAAGFFPSNGTGAGCPDIAFHHSPSSNVLQSSEQRPALITPEVNLQMPLVAASPHGINFQQYLRHQSALASRFTPPLAPQQFAQQSFDHFVSPEQDVVPWNPQIPPVGMTQPSIPIATAQMPPIPSTQPPIRNQLNDQPRPLNDYIEGLPKALVEKFQGKRSTLENGQNDIQKETFEIYRIIRNLALSEHRNLCMTEHRFDHTRFRKNYVPMSSKLPMGHVLIQSDYIYLWANVDLHCAMNFILSNYCTGFDELAIVTIIKQLTMYADRDEANARNFVRIIKAIWDRLFNEPVLMRILFEYEGKNIASYSLKTLAVTHMHYDDGIFETLLRLLDEAIAAESFVKLTTYECVFERFVKVAKGLVPKGRVDAMRRVARCTWKDAKRVMTMFKRHRQKVTVYWQQLMRR